METEQLSNDERCSMVSGSTRNTEMSPDQYGGLLLFQNRHLQDSIRASFSSEGTTGTQMSPVVPLQLGMLSQQSAVDDTTSEMSEPLIPLVKSGAKIPQPLPNNTCQESQSVEESQSLLPHLPIRTTKHGDTYTSHTTEKSSLVLTSPGPEDFQDHSQWQLTQSQRATTRTQSSNISSKQQGDITASDKGGDSDQLEKITARLDRLVASLDKVSRKQMMVMEATVTQCISNLQDSLHSRLKKHTSRISTGVVKKLLQTTQAGLIKLSEQHKTEKRQLAMQSGTQFSSQKFAMPSARSTHGNQNALDDLGKRQKKVFSLLKRQKLLMDQCKSRRLSSDVACSSDRFQLSQTQQPTVCLTETMEDDLNVNNPTRKSVKSSKEEIEKPETISLSQTLTVKAKVPQLLGKSTQSSSAANTDSDVVDNRIMKENSKECKSGNGFELELNRNNNTVKINIDTILEQGSLVQGKVVTENKFDENGSAVTFNTTDTIDNELEQSKMTWKKKYDGNKTEVDVLGNAVHEKSDDVTENESTTEEVTTIPDTQNIFTQETYTSGRDLFIDRDEDNKATRKPHEAVETELDEDKEQVNLNREPTKHKVNEISVGLDQSSVIQKEVEIRKSDTEESKAKSRKYYEEIENVTETTKSLISVNNRYGFESEVEEEIAGRDISNIQSKRPLDNDDVSVNKRKKMQSQEIIEQTDQNTSFSTPIKDSKGSEEKKTHSEMLWLNMLHTDAKKNNTNKEMKPNCSVDRQRNEVFTATKLGPDIQEIITKVPVNKNQTNNTSHKSRTEQEQASKQIVSLNLNENLPDEDQNNRDWSNQHQVSRRLKTATDCQNLEDSLQTRKITGQNNVNYSHDVVDYTTSTNMEHEYSVIQRGFLSPTVERMEVNMCSPTNATVAGDTCYNGSPMTVLHSDEETLPENTTHNGNILLKDDKYVTSKKGQSYKESSTAMSHSQPIYKEKTFMNAISTDVGTQKTSENKADKEIRKFPDYCEYDKSCARDTVSDSIDCVIQKSRYYASNTNFTHKEASDARLTNSINLVSHIDERGDNVPSNEIVQRLQNLGPEWAFSKDVSSQHVTKPQFVNSRKSLPTSSTKTLPSLKELVQKGTVTPGKLVLTCKVKGKVHTASLTPLGKIRTKEGLIFGTASQWLSTLSEGAVVKKRKAYEMIQYKGRPLLSIFTSVLPESHDMGLNLPVLKSSQPYNMPSYSISNLHHSSLDMALINPKQYNVQSNAVQKMEVLPIRRKLEGSVTEQGIQVDIKALSQQSRTITEDEKRLNNLLSTSVVRLLTENDLIPCDDLPQNFWSADFSEVKLCIDFWNIIDSW